jgi:hypothetical protein
MVALEQHYTVFEVAKLWQLSTDTIRTLFRNRAGVLKLGTAETPHKRGYVSLRDP